MKELSETKNEYILLENSRELPQSIKQNMLSAKEAYLIISKAFPDKSCYDCVEFPKLYVFDFNPTTDRFGGELGLVYKADKKTEIVSDWWFVNFADCGDENFSRKVPESEYK